MPKQRTAEEQREYQRAYRARQKEVPQPAPEPIRSAEELETRLVRDRAPGRKWINPYTDGLPDTGVLIARMSQARRDAILERINRDRTYR